jgi:hypothetical protein
MTSFLLVCTPLQWSPPRFISSSAHVSAADLQCPKQRVAGERTCRLPRRQLLVVPAGWRGGGFNYLVRSAPATGVSVRQKVETPAGQMVVGVKHSAVHVGMESALVWSEHVSFERRSGECDFAKKSHLKTEHARTCCTLTCGIFFVLFCV